MLEERVWRLEAEVSDLRERVERLGATAPERAPRQEVLVTPERASAPAAEAKGQAAPPPPEYWQPPASTSPRPEARPAAREARPVARNAPQRPGFDLPALEDLLGGRVLAWAGGLAIVVGLAFLMALGISQGWIGETARTLLGGATAAALMGGGIWLHERRGRTDAALAAFSAGVAGMFAIATVAAQVYEIVPSAAGIGLALLTGALAAALALRWESQGIAALGILGAMLAPALAGNVEGGSILILGVASLGALTVCVQQGWRWLSVAVIVVAAPEWAVSLADSPSTGQVLVTVIGFGLIGALAAVGHEVRTGAERLAASSALLLAFNAFVVGGLGWAFLGEVSTSGAANGWLCAVAAVHAVIGIVATRRDDLPKDLGLLSLSLGALAANVAFAAMVQGPSRAIGWAVAGLALAAIQGHRAAKGHERTLLTAGLGGHLALGLTQTLVDAPPSVLTGEGTLAAAPALALIALAAACFASGRIADAERSSVRTALDAVGLLVVAYITALAVDGVALVLAYAAEAIVMAALARQGREPVATAGALGNLGLAAVLALVTIPLDALATGVDDPGTVALGAAALVAAGLMVAHWEPVEGARRVLHGAAAATALYVVSVLVVTPFQPGGWAEGATLLDLPVQQQGQVVLSALWGVVGLASLVLGLVRDLRTVRVTALMLLLTTVAKVFLIDLATLTSVYRVISFLGLGLLLLLGAFAWQRVRPRELGDLRDVPAGVR